VNRSLDASQVLSMRELRARGSSVKELSKQFGKAEATVCAAVSGVTYPEAGGPITPKKSKRVSGRRSDRKLTDQQVVFMRRMRAEEKTSLRILAGMYSMSVNAVSDICAGRCYADVGGPLTRPREVYAERTNYRDDGSWEATL
jgi:hypothetical protein